MYILRYVLFGIFFCPVAMSCLDCPDVSPYWTIKEFTVSFSHPSGYYLAEDEFDGDSLHLILNFEHEYVTSTSGSFIHSALATQPCIDPGYRGAKDNLSAIEVTSDQPFLHYQPGDTLNPLLMANYFYIVKLNDWVQMINFYETPFVAVLFFNTKPDTTLERRFTIKLRFESGNELSTTTEPIYW